MDKIRQRARRAKRKIYQAGSSQHKQRLRVTNVVAHGPGTKLLHGLAQASTNGETAYTCRRRAESLKRDMVEKGPCRILPSSLLLLVWPRDSWRYSFAKERWTRPKENAAKHPSIGADGVVVSSHRLSQSFGTNKRSFETTTPSAPFKGCFAAFSLGRVHPSLARRGLASARSVFRNLNSS